MVAAPKINTGFSGKPPGAANDKSVTEQPNSPESKGNNQKVKLELGVREKSEKILGNGFNFLVLPICAVSFFSSIGSFVSANFLNGENEFLDRVTELSNKGAYFLNGIYGALNNALSNNIIGALGYSFVSFSSIVGDNENMYQWKAPGSALDQLPGLNDCTANNKKIMRKYPGQEESFNLYKNHWQSVCKTWDSIKAVSSDICDEYKLKLKEGKNIFKTTSEVFITNDRKAEKHLVVSTLGILVGFFTGIGFGFKKLGATIRDAFGILADIGVLGIAFSPSVKGQSSDSRVKYGVSGSGYLGGGFVDLAYRWLGIPKTDLLAVGLDNLGFGFMTWANADSNKRAKEIARQKNTQNSEPNFDKAA